MTAIMRANNRTPGTGVTFTSDNTTTGVLAFSQYAGAALFVVSTSTGSPVTLTFGARATGTGSAFYIMHDSANAPITLTVQAGRCYALPDDLFAVPFVMATTAGGATVNCVFTVKG